MGTYRYTLPAGSAGTGTSGDLIDQLDELFGRDIWLDLGSPKGPNLVVTPSGDWKTIGGFEALRQSLIRRYITDPGEWATKPDYGAGGKSMVKKKMTSNRIALFDSRLREQSLKDSRVEAVETVAVQADNGKLKIAVFVRPVGQTKHILPVLVEIS